MREIYTENITKSDRIDRLKAALYEKLPEDRKETGTARNGGKYGREPARYFNQ